MSEIHELLWAEKYRPKTLDEVVNQEEIVARLKVFVETKNMPHCLFAGPPGTGKTTLAHALAHDLYGPEYRRYFLELNASVAPETPVLVRVNGSIIRTDFKHLDEIYFSGLPYDVEYLKPRGLEILTLDENLNIRFKPVSYIIRHWRRRLVKIRYEGGMIRVSPDHSIIVMNEEGQLVPKSASNIKPGDMLLSFKTVLQGVGGLAISSYDEAVMEKTLNEYNVVQTGLLVRLMRIPHSIYNSSPSTRLKFLKEHSKPAINEKGYYLRYTSTSRDKLVDMAWLGRISGLETSVLKRETKIIWKPHMACNVSELVDVKPIIRLAEKASISYVHTLRNQLYDDKARVKKSVAIRLLLRIIRSSDDNLALKAKSLLKLLRSGVHSVLVKSVTIEDYNGWVYDVSVPGVERFWGGEIPILLHNSDARGIDVIRTTVKEFARSVVPGPVPFKILVLDEADNMTADAQQALRRLMEMYTANTRFILIANYPSKIIEPIQSRTAFFRFTALREEDVIGRLKWIAENENVDYELDALKAIHDLSEGDLRKAINILQASAALGKVSVDTVYKVVGSAHPREIREMINLALDGKFTLAREKLRQIMINYGLSGADIIKQVHREIFSTDIKLPEEARVLIADYAGEIQFRLVEGADDEIQLNAFLARLALIGKKMRS